MIDNLDWCLFCRNPQWVKYVYVNGIDAGKELKQTMTESGLVNCMVWVIILATIYDHGYNVANICLLDQLKMWCRIWFVVLKKILQ
jgi:hypothetical protein